jgi:hypothetical protein
MDTPDTFDELINIWDEPEPSEILLDSYNEPKKIKFSMGHYDGNKECFFLNIMTNRGEEKGTITLFPDQVEELDKLLDIFFRRQT